MANPLIFVPNTVQASLAKAVFLLEDLLKQVFASLKSTLVVGIPTKTISNALNLFLHK